MSFYTTLFGAKFCEVCFIATECKKEVLRVKNLISMPEFQGFVGKFGSTPDKNLTP
jgi:hypothetical protein